MKTKQEAEKVAKILQNQLNKDWKIDIFENFGWHVHACNGLLSVHWEEYTKNAVNNPKFSCLMSDSPNDSRYYYAGSSLWTPDVCSTGKNVRKIIQKQVNLARKKVDELNNVVRLAEVILSELNAVPISKQIK